VDLGQIITKSFEFTNGEGQRVKVTRKIKIHKDEVKVPKEVQRRRVSRFDFYCAVLMG